MITNMPIVSKMYQSFPNPFRQMTSIRFEIPGAQNVLVKMEIINLQGKLIRTLVNGDRAPGIYSVSWDGKGNNNMAIPSGTYLCRFRAGSFSDNKKIVMVK